MCASWNTAALWFYRVFKSSKKKSTRFGKMAGNTPCLQENELSLAERGKWMQEGWPCSSLVFTVGGRPGEQYSTGWWSSGFGNTDTCCCWCICRNIKQRPGPNLLHLAYSVLLWRQHYCFLSLCLLTPPPSDTTDTASDPGFSRRKGGEDRASCWGSATI